MALESGTYLDDLVNTNPTASDNVSQGDDHLRLIKRVLKNSFPSVDAAVNAIHTGTSAPSTSIAQGLLWVDTTNNVLKLYDGSSWVVLPVSPATSYKLMGSLTAGWTMPTADGTDGQVMKTDGSGAFTFVNPGSVLTAGEGIDISTNTISGEDASDSNKGIATFNTANFANSSGDITIKDGGVANAELVNSSITVSDGSNSTATALGGTITYAAGEGIDVAESSGTITVSGEDASDSNKGIATFNTANFANSSGDITIKDGGVANAELANMAANTIKVRDANSSGVPSDKALASTEILIGDGTGFTAASLSGDVSMTNAGAVTVDSIQGTSVTSTAPSDDQYLKYSASSTEWQCVSITGTDKLTTKGDLLVYNTVDSETRLAVGTNDYALLADSGATNGVDWKQVATATIADDAVTGAKISFIDDSIAATDTHIMVADGTDYNNVAVSGDISLANNGTATIADNAVSLAKMAGLARGRIIYGDSSGDPAALAVGSSAQVLTSDGTDISWATPSTGIDDLTDALVENNSIWLGNDPSGTTDTASYSVALGTTALDAITTGDNNTAIGYNSLSANTTGGNNSSVGYNSLRDNTTGSDNTAIGKSASWGNTTGVSNTSVGKDALGANTTANNNTAVGYAALDANTTGASNTVLGSGSLGANTTASNNTAVGYLALTANTTGSSNTAVGNTSSDAITTGAYNTALGDSSLGSQTTASENTAIGFQAGFTNLTGVGLTALGTKALYYSTGANNTGVGYQAALNVTTGENNAAVGYQALLSCVTTDQNTAFGSLAGNSVTGSNNTCLGYDADNSSDYQSNEFTLGNDSVDNLRCNDTSISALSDERDKAEVSNLPSVAGLDFINSLRPITYYWDRREWYEDGEPDGSKIKHDVEEGVANTGQRMGFIAQEVKGSLSGMKYMEDSKMVGGTEEKLEFAPAQLVTSLVKAIQQLSEEVESLKAQLEE